MDEAAVGPPIALENGLDLQLVINILETHHKKHNMYFNYILYLLLMLKRINT